MTRRRPSRAWTRTLLPAAAALVALGALAGPASAAPSSSKQPKVEVELLSDTTHAVPGQSFRAGVKFKLEPGWHVYWHNPGDTGLPTRITFGARDGASFGEIQWPIPERYVDKIGGVSFGYADEVVLFSHVRVPEDALEGESLELTADAAWLVCKENCINGKASLALPVTVSAEARASEQAPVLDRFAARVAPEQPADLTLTQTLDKVAVAPGEPFSVTLVVSDKDGEALTAPEDITTAFLPAPERGLKVTDVTQATGAEGLPAGAVAFTVSGRATATAKHKGAAVPGVVQVVRKGETLSFQATLDVPRKDGPAVAAVTGAEVGSAEIVPHVGSAGDADALCAEAMGAVAADGDDGGAAAGLTSFWLALLFAFLGGLILNAMPCVLPVLSIKVMSLVEQSGDDRKTVWRHGLVYTAGVLVSFAVFGAIIIGVQASGGTAGWAFQFQDPVFVAIFAAVIFAFGLSLFGVFEIALPGMSKIDAKVAGSHGYMSSFNYGVFAVLLGTPCTAPLLGPAMGFAFTQPPLELMAILLMVGLGLAFPFLMMARYPAWQRLLPKPGPWLTTFKKVMAFLLIGTAVWMVTILSAQVSRDALNGYLIFLLALSVGLWVYGHWAAPYRSRRSRFIGMAVAVGITVGVGALFLSAEPPEARSGTIVKGGIEWEDFDTVDVEALAAEGRTVFIDFTAEWCPTCKVNEQVAIYTDEVRTVLAGRDVLPVLADYTIKKPKITEWLARFNEPSVPMYIVIPGGRPADAFKLPSFPLAIDDVVGGLCKATAPVSTAGL